MGRTNATYRNHLDRFFDRFKTYRTGLRHENQGYFDQLKEKAYSYAHAASYHNPERPALPAFLSMLVGLQKESRENREELEELRNEVEFLKQKAFEEGGEGVQG